MLQFQPPGFGQQVFKTSLGIMAYYTPMAPLWSTEADRPTLVFLHSLGGGSSAYEWSKVYPVFAASHHVIAPDLIGWGQSTHPVRDYQVEDYLTVLSELLEQMNPPVIAVASSLTAGILIRLAIAHPELVRLLFLVSPTGFADFGSDYGQNAAARIAAIPGIDRLIYTLGAANELAVRNFLEQFLLAERSRLSNETVAAYLASAQQFNAEYSALASLRGDLCFDLSLYIQQLSTPTAFVVGEKSRFGSPKMARRLADLNRSTVQWFWEIPQVGVLPHLETPAVVAGLLAQVLQCA